MKTWKFSMTLWVVLLFGSCAGVSDDSVTYQIIENDTLYVCDASKISRLETVKLNDWVSDFQVVRFEDLDTALFKAWKIYVTDHYIGILQSDRMAFKLFDRQGRFICDVGSVGQGPGEYAMLYSAAIDEKTNTICLAPFTGDKLMKYNMNGEFICSIDIGRMQKPQIRFESDGSITLTHLCFKDMTAFQYARIDKDNHVSYVLPDKNRAVDARDKDGNFVGFNHEVWFRNNIADFTSMTTAHDTLYKFNLNNEQTTPRFTMTNHTGYYCIYNEYPSCFMIHIGSMSQDAPPLSDIIITEKQPKQSYYAKIVNDKVGNLPVKSLSHWNDGWYCEMYEPGELIEKIEAHLKENKCSKEDRRILEELQNSIDDNGNNILFVGKIKK